MIIKIGFNRKLTATKTLNRLGSLKFYSVSFSLTDRGLIPPIDFEVLLLTEFTSASRLNLIFLTTKVLNLTSVFFSANLRCIEQYVSATGIVLTAKEYCKTRPEKSLLKEFDIDSITSVDVYRMAMKGDELALKIFEYTGKILGRAFANFVVFSNPEAIILFGGLTKADDLLMNPVRKSMEERLLPLFRGKIKLLISELKECDAAVLGASSLGWGARERQLQLLTMQNAEIK